VINPEQYVEFLEHYLEFIGYADSTSTYGLLIMIFGLVQSIAVAVITGLFHRESKRRKANDEEVARRAAVRAEESLLNMKMSVAGVDLTILAAKNSRASMLTAKWMRQLKGRRKPKESILQ